MKALFPFLCCGQYITHPHIMCKRGHFSSLFILLFLPTVSSTESWMTGFSFASIHMSKGPFGLSNTWSLGHPHVAGSEQQGAHHWCLPPRHFLFLLPEACEWHEHCQRLPSLLPSLQTRLQELLHPRRHHLHQGHCWPHRPLRCLMSLLRHALFSSP